MGGLISLSQPWLRGRVNSELGLEQCYVLHVITFQYQQRTDAVLHLTQHTTYHALLFTVKNKIKKCDMFSNQLLVGQSFDLPTTLHLISASST